MRASFVSPGICLAAVVATAHGQPDQIGQWGPSTNLQIVAVHLHVLPTGKVMYSSYGDDARTWDPASGTISLLPQVGYNIFCTGHSLLPGRAPSSGECPIDAATLDIAAVLPSGHFGAQGGAILNASIQSDLDLRHVKPARMFGRVVEDDLRTHELLEAGSEVGIEVVEHQMHGRGGRIDRLDQMTHEVGESVLVRRAVTSTKR